jgi:cytochrome c
MVRYILEINEPKNQKQTLPLRGSVALQHKDAEPRGVYTITARYTDNGSNGGGSLSDSEVIKLRNAKMRPIDADLYVGIDRWRETFGRARNRSYLMLRNVDLTGIREITYEYGAKNRSGEIEVRLESLAGPVISRTPFKPTGDWDEREKVTTSIEPPPGRHHVYLIVISTEKTGDDLMKLWSFEFGE